MLVVEESGSSRDISLAEGIKESEHLEQETRPHSFLKYLLKFGGVDGKIAPPMTTFEHMVASSMLAIVGLLLVSITDSFYLLDNFGTDGIGVKMLTGAYAATAVLVYDAYQSPLAQPKNVIGGFLVSSIIGVSIRIACEHADIPIWASGPISVAFAILGMNITKTTHPPGGACALISIIGGDPVHALGYGYVLTSVGGAFIMVAIAVLGNNILSSRQYPLYWI